MRVLLTGIIWIFKLTVALALVWSALGLVFVLVAPGLQDSLKQRVHQRTGLHINGSQLEGYFYFYRVGIRLHDPRISDDEGLILGGKVLELELHPISQWYAGFLSPIRVHATGMHLNLEMIDVHTWRLQKRYVFHAGVRHEPNYSDNIADLSEPQESSPEPNAGAREDEAGQTEANGETAPGSGAEPPGSGAEPPDTESDLEEFLALFDIFGGRASLENGELTLYLHPTGKTRTLSQIDITVQGGAEPTAIVEILSPSIYSEGARAEFRVDRSSRKYLYLFYEFALTNFNNVFFEEFFPDALKSNSIRANITTSGSWSAVRQSHQIDFEISEQIDSAGGAAQTNSAQGSLSISLGEESLEIHLPRLQYLVERSGQSHQILVENFQYHDYRAAAHILSLNLVLGRLRIDREAGIALVDLKKRLLPETMNFADEIIADIDITQLRLRLNPLEKEIAHASGQTRINFLQVEQGTYFSNIDLGLSSSENAMHIQFQATATDLAIAGILEPVRIHAARDGGIDLMRRQKNWFISAGIDQVEISPGQFINIGGSVEFKPGFSPWIWIRFSGQDLRTEIVQAYIPRLALNPNLDRWLWDSLSGGELKEGFVEYGGNALLARPEIRPEIFSARLRLRDVDLRYHPKWPTLSSVGGEISIEASALNFQIQGGYRDMRISTKGRIPSFAHPVLTVEADSQGSYADLRSFTLNSPLAPRLETFFAASQGEGELNNHSTIVVDLGGEDDAQYSGFVELNDFSLRLTGYDLSLERLSGRVRYNQKSIHSQNLRAWFGAEEIRGQVDSVNEMGAERISVEITLQQRPADVLDMPALVDSMGAHGKSAWYLRYLSSAQGAAAGAPQGNPGRSYLYIHTDLLGVELARHTSITKRAGSLMPLSLAAGDLPGGRWIGQAQLDDKIDARAVLDFDRDGQPVVAAHLRFHDEPGDETTDSSAPIKSGSGQQESSGAATMAARARPPVATETANADQEETPAEESAIMSLLTGKEPAKLQLIRNNARAMWKQIDRPGFADSLIDDQIIAEGNIAALALEPWTKDINIDEKPAHRNEGEQQQTGAGDGRQPDDAGTAGGQELVWRFRVGIGKLDVFGLPFTAVKLDYAFADKKIDLKFSSAETKFRLFFDLLGREAMRIDIERLQYALKPRAPANKAPQSDDSKAGKEPDSAPEDNQAGSAAADDVTSQETPGPGAKAALVDAAATSSAKPGHADAQADATDTVDAGTTEDSGPIDPVYGIPERHVKIYDILHGLGEIDFRCRLCQVDKISLRNIEALFKAGDENIEGRARYFDEEIGEEISINAGWSKSPGAMAVKIVLRAKSEDLAQSLLNHGAEAALGGEGQIEMSVQWQGSLLQFHYPTLNGDFKANLKDGVIYGLGTSSAQRLLSIVNLLEIPRRFSLDFSDMGQDFEFYRANIDASIENGVVRINEQTPLHLRSALGKMDAFGDIDLVKERYKVGAHLIPSVVTFTAPIVALLIAGPVAGVSVIGLNWLLSAFNVDTNTVAEQYNIIDSSFESLELRPVSSRRFQQWKKEYIANRPGV